ncbi:MAG: hypothetical protein ACOX86_02925 [Pelotomaculaceae bacterium]|nr:hypothetical protein [Bacillota bacterium]
MGKILSGRNGPMDQAVSQKRRCQEDAGAIDLACRAEICDTASTLNNG